MRAHQFIVGIGICLVVAGRACPAQTLTYITAYSKTDNIYTNLNEQFPHSGTGTPGSGVGTPNSSFIFNPATYTSANAVAAANQTTNGVTFNIASDSSGHDFTEVQGLPGSTLTIPVSVANASSISFLMNGYNNPLATFTFSGTGGAVETFSNVGLHDFNAQSSPRNSSQIFHGSSPDFFDQTAFQVNDQGAGGTGNSTTGDVAIYGIDEDSFLLSSAFLGQTLDSISISTGSFDPILLGVTVVSPTQIASNGTPEPGAVALLAAGSSMVCLVIRRRRQSRTK